MYSGCGSCPGIGSLWNNTVWAIFGLAFVRFAVRNVRNVGGFLDSFVVAPLIWSATVGPLLPTARLWRVFRVIFVMFCRRRRRLVHDSS